MSRRSNRALGGITICLAVFTSLRLPSLTLAAGVGPAVTTNFPDPCLAFENGTWYAFSTQSQKINVQLASTPDFTSWTLHTGFDALPKLPAWARLPPDGAVWAPDVNQRPDGSWVMYFAAVGVDHPRKHCVAAATSPNVTGPYTPHQGTLVCDLPEGGNIDPNLFRDPVNGNNYLIYKVDGNAIGHGGACGNGAEPIAPTPLYMQLMDPNDLITPIGQPVRIFSNDKEDGPNIERPCVVFQQNTYYVIYNSQCYTSLNYHIAYVSCVVGVDTKGGIDGCDWPALKLKQETRPDHTLLRTGDVVSGTKLYAPGSMDVGPDQRKVVFHGDVNLQWFAPDHPVTLRRHRALFAGEVDFVNGKLSVTKLY